MQAKEKKVGGGLDWPPVYYYERHLVDALTGDDIGQRECGEGRINFNPKEGDLAEVMALRFFDDGRNPLVAISPNASLFVEYSSDNFWFFYYLLIQ